MKISECFPYTFKALRHELGHDRPKDQRPMWQRRLSTESAFCRALVACGYLTEAQMRRAAERYRLGMSRDGGVIFWQMDQLEQVYDGKIMYYRPDCHRDHDRHPQWAANLLKRQFLRQFPDMAPWLPDSAAALCRRRGREDRRHPLPALPPVPVVSGRRAERADARQAVPAQETPHHPLPRYRRAVPRLHPLVPYSTRSLPDAGPDRHRQSPARTQSHTRPETTQDRPRRLPLRKPSEVMAFSLQSNGIFDPN